MSINKTAIQSELDKAAEELERSGSVDLAARVDYYGDRLIRATAGEIPIIRRALSRILEEARKRAMQNAEKSESAKKAEHATVRARRASEVRKQVLRRRLSSIIARRKQAAAQLEAAQTPKEEPKKEEHSSRRSRRQARLSKDKE